MDFMIYLNNLLKTLAILLVTALVMIISFYTSFLAIPIIVLTIAGIGIYNYLKYR